MSILSSPAILGAVIGLIVVIVLAVVFPGIRRLLLTTVVYIAFAIALSIRFYVLLPIGLARSIMYFFLGEITDLLSGDHTHPIIKVTRAYLPKMFLIQLQRYNGMGDQVPGFSVLALRYFITIVVYSGLGILYLWIRFEYNTSNIWIERIFIGLAIGILINIFSAGLYHIISAIVKSRVKPVVVEEVKLPENKLSTATLYKVSSHSDDKDSIMHIYRVSAPLLARMQRNDLSIKPYFIAYKKGDQDFYQYDDSFNITELIRVVNELPVIDEKEGMIYYCIYYRDGKNFHKTEYMTRERLKILSKAIFTIYAR